MNRPITLSLAIALALGNTAVNALGLGAIEVRSGLNQPLLAEIAVTESLPGEADGLRAQLASAADFARVGLDTSGVTVPLTFEVVQSKNGKWVIQVTSEAPVREPFLRFLVDAGWSNGRVLREYNLLLDPPVVAPAIMTSRTVVEPAVEATPIAAEPLVEEPTTESSVEPSAELSDTEAATESTQTPEPNEQVETVEESQPLVEDQPVAQEAEPVSEQVEAPASSLALAEYGPVAAGDTLWEIASNARSGAQVTVNQMMVAILRANPEAFAKDNVNALKRGVVLRIPAESDVSAIAAAEAAAEIIAQNQAWRSSRVTTLASSSASSNAQVDEPSSVSEQPNESASTTTGSRLELLPPKSAEETGAGADRPGTSGGTDANAQLSTELAQTKEQLASRDLEAAELRAHVQDLERLTNDSQRLISLKDSEIADLQRRLKELQEAQEKADLAEKAQNTEQQVEDKAPEPVSTEPATTEVPAELKPDPEVLAEAPENTEVKSVDEAAISSDQAEPSQEVTQVEEPVSTETTTADPQSQPVESTAVTEPLNSDVAVEATPVSSDTGQQVPWWRANMIALGGGLAVILAGLAFLLLRGRSKPAANAASKASVADSFASGVFGDGEEQADSLEIELLEKLAADPTHLAAHLELLKVYYGQNNADKFEAAAGAMYAQVGDLNAEEWQEACVMGRDLLPGSSMFEASETQVHDFSQHSEQVADPMDVHPHSESVNSDQVSYSMDRGMSDVSLDVSTSSIDSDITAIKEQQLVMPELDLDLASADLITPSSDEFLDGEDAIGTKLDLARAYLDMGDPEGARSMLQEVLNEGNELQKQEAQRLLDEMK